MTSPEATVQIPAQPTFGDDGLPAGLQNYRRWSDRLSQGGEPHGDVAFANLAAMGVKTIVSVDGARPDAETAAKYGIRYVHVPFGYDGVPRDAQLRIVKAVETSDGPVYVHCHHGQHRGPAGAMIARVAVDGVSNEEAVRELTESGCDAAYKGLFRDVMQAVPPTRDELSKVPATLPSYVSPGDFADHMASLSRTWETLGFVKDASWKTPPAHPDVDPPHEARMLWEKLREAQRLDAAKGRGDEFLGMLQRAEKGGTSLEDYLRKGDSVGAAKAFGEIKQTCDSCHARWRN